MNVSAFSRVVSSKNESFLNTTTPVNYTDVISLGFRILTNLIGIVGNILLLTACVKQQKNHPSSVNCLIAQLSGYWLFQCGVCYFPYNSVRLAELFGMYISSGFCPPFMTAGMFANVYGNCIDITVALNRLCAIWLPVHYRKVSSPKVTAGMSLLAAGLSLFGLFPLYGIHSRLVHLKSNGVCFVVSTGRVGSAVLMVSSIGPIVFTGVCYALLLCKIVHMLHKQRQTTAIKLHGQPDEGHKTTSLSMQRRIRVSVALLGAFGCALVCTLPFYFVAMMLSSNPGISATVVFWVGTVLHSKYSIAPYIMIWISGDYKSVVTRIVFGKRAEVVSPKTPATSNTSAGDRLAQLRGTSKQDAQI